MSDFASLCVLSYNRREFVEEAIATLHANAQHPFELIVHDDGSDEEVSDTLVSYLRHGLISTLILNPPGHNQGQGVALNRMFNAAKGDPIVKLDQDLLFREGWLKKLTYLLDSNTQVSMPPDRGTPPHPIHLREPRVGLMGLLHYWLEPVDSAKTRLEQFEGWSSRTHILGSGFAVTRECWERLGPFEEGSDAFGEDWDFQNRVTADADFVCGLPDEDLVDNQGMGPPHSTIVAYNGSGEVVVTTIKKGPVIFR